MGVWLGDEHKNKHRKDVCLKRDWTTVLNCLNYSTLGSEHNWDETYVFYQDINNYSRLLVA
jgi:hypothetical protein